MNLINAFDARGKATPLNLNTRVWLEQHMDGLSIECSTGSIVVQMASPSATFILESVVRGHHIYKLDVGMFVDGRKYRRRLMVVLSMINNNKLIAYLYVYVCIVINVALSRDQCSINQFIA